MKHKDLVSILKETNSSLQKTLDSQAKTIESLTAEVASLKEALLEKTGKNEALVSRLNGLSKITLPKKTEKRNYVDKSLKSTTPKPKPDERGNNGAKRKVYNNLEEVVVEVEPTHPEFVNLQNDATHILTREVIRYKFIQPRLIKYVYKCRSYKVDDKIYEGVAPIAPFLNSNFDSSVIAHIMQQRFVYGLPVERIVRYVAEMGMDIPKPTIHGLLKKGAILLDMLKPALENAILNDKYLHFDETYHTVLDKNSTGGSRKGYFWSVLSNKSKLIQFFIDESASRSKTAFTSYLPTTYKGVIQTDGYSVYKVLDNWEYTDVIRLGCMQQKQT